MEGISQNAAIVGRSRPAGDRMNPVISVLVPSYNYVQYITQAIDSALAQTYPNVEVVVTDNISSDATVETIRTRYAGDPRVRLFVNERNIGLVPNFNRALAHARGEFVLWLSADDWLLPTHLARLHEVFEREPSLDVVYSGAYYCNEPGRLYNVRNMPGQLSVDYVDARDELIDMLTTVCQVCLPTALFRRGLFDELGPMDEGLRVAADWELAVRIAIAGKRFGYLNAPSMCVRLHGDQASGNEYHADGSNYLEFFHVVEKFIDHPAMARLRGWEARMLSLLATLDAHARDKRGANFEPAVEARLAAVRRTLERRAATYEPARASEQRVSVVIPATRPGPVFAALDSVLAQTHANWEICLIDHGEIPLEHLLRAHPAWDRISLLRLAKPLFPGAARNLALRLIRGEYVAYLDEDNRFRPDHLASLIDRIERSGAEVAVASAALIVERADARGLGRVPVAESSNIFREERDPAELELIANATPLNAVLHHRRTLVRSESFNETLPILEDFEYLLRLERFAPFAYTGAVTLEVCTTLGLVGQSLETRRAYLPVLDAVYGAHPASGAVVQSRAVHRRTLERVLATAAETTGSPQGAAEFVAVLAGRDVVAPPVRR
jgi:O-antigen biosynthesis protein